jgi:serine/threonine protein kinase
VSGKKTPFYVMPLYAGTLRTLMNQQLDPQKRLQYFIQILHGVDAAHKKGVHHRDIKPENVLFDATHDRMIVSDLGIAHFSEEDLLTAVETRAEQRLANFVYAAPEQRIRGGKTDGRTDIFSLGLILNELYTGVVPHGTGPTQIGNVVPDLAYLDLIVETMIRNNPSDRYAAIDDVLDAIRASGVEFATKQKISVLTKEVIPSSQSDDPMGAN